MRFLNCVMFLLLLSVVGVQAVDISLNVTETGSVINYYGIYYIADVEGSVTITNENDFRVYTIEVPMTPGTLSYIETTSFDFLDESGIKIPYLDPHETVSLGYKIFGITTENIVEYYSDDGTSVFTHLMDDRKAYFRSDLWINLEKSQLGTIRNEPGRFVAVSITNPTPLEYQIKSIQVSRTADDNVNNPEKIWTFEDKIKILGGDDWFREFEDYGSGVKESSVYWFIVDHELANSFMQIHDNSTIELYDESDLDEFPKIDDQNRTIGDEVDKNIYARSKVFVRKVVDPGRVFPGDIINVSIITTNLDVESKAVRVQDTLPPGFELYEVYTKDSLIDRDSLIWDINVNRDTSRVVKYAIRFIDEEAIGLAYLPEASATFDEGRVTSSRVPIIKQFIPQKKLYVQKNIRRLPKDVVEVTLNVRNLGEATLEDVLMKDYLGAEDMFSEITQTPLEKGLWEIPSLAKNEQWQVKYKTLTHPDIDRLPQIFGVDEANVLKTLIMDNLVANYVFSPSISMIELLGLVSVIIFPFVAIYLYRKKVLEKKDF
jgi:hypothetical protein